MSKRRRVLLVLLGLSILIGQSIFGIGLGMFPVSRFSQQGYYSVQFSQWPFIVNEILAWGLILWGLFGERGKGKDE